MKLFGRTIRKMKLLLLLLLASICICLQPVGSQQQPEQNLEEQIRKLQTQVKQLWEYLKDVQLFIFK